MLTVTVCYRERIQINTASQRKRCIGQSGRVPDTKLLLSSGHILMASVCDSTHRILAPGEAYPNFGVQRLLLIDLLSKWLNSVSPLTLSPPQRSDAGCGGPIMNNRYSSLREFQRFRSDLPGVQHKGQTSLWSRPDSYCTCPSEALVHH